MDEKSVGERIRQETKFQPKVNLRRLLIILAVGFVPTVVSYLLDWWWGGTLFLLITLFVACFSFVTKLYPLVFTCYATIAIALVSGGLLQGMLLAQWDVDPGRRNTIAVVAGLAGGIALPLAFWFVVLFVSTSWILAVTDSFDIPWRKAFWFVASRIFQISQAAIVVENGAIAFQQPPGMLSSLKGPGFLIVGVGNACVLERSGHVTRIVGPGFYQLGRFESLKRPVDGKGILDLRPQFKSDVAKEMRTRDGIPLQITVAEFFQLEPKHITEARPGSQFAGGDAKSKLHGVPEHPVYEAILHRAVFGIPEGGWKDGWFPSDPIACLRDVIATYDLDEIFSLDSSTKPDGTPEPASDRRVIQRIEEEVRERFAPQAAKGGVWFKGIDIREISMPPEIEERLTKKWTAKVERDFRREDAAAERDALITWSEGRARSIERLEGVRLEARARMIRVLQELVHMLPEGDQDRVMTGFISVFEQLTSHVGQDETVAMRYIEAMQAIIASDGSKTFFITPPNASPGFLPSRPRTMLQPTTESTEKKE